MDKHVIKKEAALLLDEMIEIRRHLHMYPELGEEEFETQKFIIRFLEKEGISYEKSADTGVVAFIQGERAGKVIGLRADIDALPIQEKNEVSYCSKKDGIMHACGHDAHTAIALGYAKYFRHHQDFAGALKIFFQPAEETVGGAKRMIQEGCLENPKVDYCIGLHVHTALPSGQIELKYGALNASTDSFEIVFRGKTCHGAYPELGIDAVLMACQTITMIQSITSRTVSALDSAVVTFGSIHGGEAGNVIADEVRVRGTARTLLPKTREMVLHKLQVISESIATSMGGTAEYIPDEGCYIPLINDDYVTSVLEHTANELLGEENVFRKSESSMGGEDFSFFCEAVPGSFYHLGAQKIGHECGGHTAVFDIDESCLLTGLCVHIGVTLELLKER